LLENLQIEKIITLARLAGIEVIKVYKEPIKVEEKADHTPLTLADTRSNEIIIKGLKEFFPDVPILSEETKQVDYSVRKNWDYFWCIDPLDGTKEFIKHNGEFTINIALIHNTQPVASVLFAPALNKMYYAAKGLGSFFVDEKGNSIKLTSQPNYLSKQKINVVASRSHLTDDVLQFVEDLKKQGKEVEFVSSGSSLKFCLVAEGKADVYPRFGPTMEWDTAAGQAIVECAGGKVLQHKTATPLSYNKENLLNPFFVVEF